MISSFQHVFLEEVMPAYVSSLAMIFDRYILHTYKYARAEKAKFLYKDKIFSQTKLNLPELFFFPFVFIAFDRR
jgi:hypothetical protein